jgi:7SK snRNA methylphosphate capping enzyme
MEKPWFQNRRCLDIGCNEGVVTLSLAMRFGTECMLGVDIDQTLINKASRSGHSCPVWGRHSSPTP